MYAKRFIPLFIAVLLTLLAGNGVYAQGPYDRSVVAKFVGEWRDAAHYQYPIWLTIEDRSTYAIVRIKHCTGLSLPKMVDCTSFSTGEEQFLTRDGKLLHYFTGSYGIRVWHEYEILPNGHLLERWTTVRPIEGGKTENLIGEEYVRASGPSLAAPTRAPVVSPVIPVQPVVPGAGKAGYFEKLGQRVTSCSGQTGEQHSQLWQPLLDIWNRVRKLFSASPVVAADRFREGECTWLVAKERPDVRDWLPPSGADAHTWDDWAVHEDWGAFYGLHVDHEPDAGDIVVWKKECGGPYASNGHVAYVTGVRGKLIVVNEANHITAEHPNGDHQTYYGSEYEIRPYSCMRFIHKPTVFERAP